MLLPDVITLSSSPLGSPRVGQSHPAKPTNSICRPSYTADDSFWDDMLKSAEKPLKRRKLNPTPDEKSTTILKGTESVFELSSEPDIDLLAPQTTLGVISRSPKVTIHDLEDVEDEVPSFTSSAPLPSRPARPISTTIELFSDDVVDLSDPISSPVRHVTSAKLNVSAETAALLERASRKPKKPVHSSRPVNSYSKASKSMQSSRSSAEVADNIIDSSQTSTQKMDNTSSKPNIRNKAPVRQKKTSAEKEAEKEEKRLEKERKAAEKQKAADIAEVNQRKTDKAKAVNEMIIDLPNTLKGKSLGNKIEAEIKNNGAEYCYYADEVDLTEVATGRRLGNIIRWRRKVPSVYDKASEEWIPVRSTKVDREKHILVHLPAEDFCLIAARNSTEDNASTPLQIPTEEEMTDNLDIYVTMLRSRFPQYTIVILIEGLAQWLKKNANAKNREYAAAVRAQGEPTEETTAGPPSSTQATNRVSKKRKDQTSASLIFLNSDIVEGLMLHLQLVHRPLYIHHTTSSECYRQIVSFTQHLSTRPYRNVELERNLAHASFCMASGQFRTGGGDPADTWIKMLEQLNRLTIPYAKGIWDAGFESPAQLLKGFKKTEKSITGGSQSLGGDSNIERQAREKAKLMLQDVRRNNSDKRIGPQISKRLYKVFTSRDEDSRDGIA